MRIPVRVRAAVAADASSRAAALSRTPAAGRRRVLSYGVAATAAAVATGTGGAHAQGGAAGNWPTRQVRIVLPFPPGGASDTALRPITKRVGEILGQQILIDYRTGGNSVVAANATLGAPKDGYTFLWDAANQLTNPVLIKELAFDYRTAFTPVTMVLRAPQTLIVRQDFPARNLKEFLDAARAKPGTISVGTPPSGAMAHLALAMLQQRAGVKLIHTPYRGGSEAARDVMGGQIDAVVVTTATARGMLPTGKVRMLAVTSAERVPAYADVPTVAESGYPGYDMDDWFGLFAASGTPEASMRGLQAGFAEAAKDPALRETLASFGLVMVVNETAAFVDWLERQRTVLQQLIRDNNIAIG